MGSFCYGAGLNLQQCYLSYVGKLAPTVICVITLGCAINVPD